MSALPDNAYRLLLDYWWERGTDVLAETNLAPLAATVVRDLDAALRASLAPETDRDAGIQRLAALMDPLPRRYTTLDDRAAALYDAGLRAPSLERARHPEADDECRFVTVPPPGSGSRCETHGSVEVDAGLARCRLAIREAFTDAGRAGFTDLSADMEEGIRRFEAEAAVSRTWRGQRVPIEGARHPEAGEHPDE